MIDTTEAIDSVELFLFQGERLEPRSGSGGDQATQADRDVALALAREIATNGIARKMTLSEVTAETVHPPFGIPLMQGERAIGVLIFGSRVDLPNSAAGDFVDFTTGMLGHDLRNPLNIITLGASALRASQNLDEKQRRHIQRIEEHAQRMAGMISDFLDLTRARLGGGIQIGVKAIDFQQISRGVLEGIERAHPGRPLHLRTIGDICGIGDPDRVAQVVTNLVINAIQYGRDGTPIEVSLARKATAIELEVHNEGDPISDDILPHVFEPFRCRKAQRRHETAHAGLGLGLFIVDAIARAHGGLVTVDSRVDRGTSFRVTWPT